MRNVFDFRKVPERTEQETIDEMAEISSDLIPLFDTYLPYINKPSSLSLEQARYFIANSYNISLGTGIKWSDVLETKTEAFADVDLTKKADALTKAIRTFFKKVPGGANRFGKTKSDYQLMPEHLLVLVFIFADPALLEDAYDLWVESGNPLFADSEKIVSPESMQKALRTYDVDYIRGNFNNIFQFFMMFAQQFQLEVPESDVSARAISSNTIISDRRAYRLFYQSFTPFMVAGSNMIYSLKYDRKSTNKVRIIYNVDYNELNEPEMVLVADKADYKKLPIAKAKLTDILAPHAYIIMELFILQMIFLFDDDELLQVAKEIAKFVQLYSEKPEHRNAAHFVVTSAALIAMERNYTTNEWKSLGPLMTEIIRSY